ncbi:MAG: sigma-70 family RNA polymerase sigma factor [Acidisphaera sp.]|nr:sigma-70 family RNA polymerase sigma factor [Acidisphaera sp.]MBV9812782.1 sigma-70 family RNA polymerase sigma factor [Acetobacteraceae bacterium]
MVRLLPDLRRFARFLTGRHDIDDLLQETVTRALAALDQFQPGTDMRAWVFAILRNTFYEQSRRHQTEARAMDRANPPEEAQAPSQVAQMEFADLERALQALSPLLREALVLVGAHELSYEAAAQICGVPQGTVKARVSRARRALAHAMRRAHVEVEGQ